MYCIYTLVEKEPYIHSPRTVISNLFHVGVPPWQPVGLQLKSDACAWHLGELPPTEGNYEGFLGCFTLNPKPWTLNPYTPRFLGSETDLRPYLFGQSE